MFNEVLKLEIRTPALSSAVVGELHTNDSSIKCIILIGTFVSWQ